MQLKMAYDNFENASNETGLKCEDKTMAQQQFKEECDILTIVERFGLTGEMPTVLQLPQYGDFTGIFDYQSAQNAIRAATESFMSLPAHIRARFHNDPQEMLDFTENVDNKDEAIKMGLVNKPEPVVEPAGGGGDTSAAAAPGKPA